MILSPIMLYQGDSYRVRLSIAKLRSGKDRSEEED